jgi:hypothetical protein
MARKNKNSKNRQPVMVFQSINYKLLVIGILLVAAGFAAMYIDDKLTGIVALYISPIIIIAGYIVVIFSIISNISNEKAAEKKHPK